MLLGLLLIITLYALLRLVEMCHTHRQHRWLSVLFAVGALAILVVAGITLTDVVQSMQEAAEAQKRLETYQAIDDLRRALDALQ